MTPTDSVAIEALRERVVELEKDLAEEETESEHYLRLAIVDPGANNQVSWKERAEAAEARNRELLRKVGERAKWASDANDRADAAEARVVELEGELKHEQGKLWNSAGRNNALQKRADAAEARVVELTGE